MIFVLQAGRNRHEHICESLELFGSEVLPAFKERDDRQVEAKAARLEPMVDAAMARRAERAERPPPLPTDYAFPALPRRWADETKSDEMREWLEHFADARAKGHKHEGLGILGS